MNFFQFELEMQVKQRVSVVFLLIIVLIFKNLIIFLYNGKK